MKVISIRQSPSYKDVAITYFKKAWSHVLPVIYEDAISHSVDAKNSLPQWCLLESEGEIIGCAGLISQMILLVEEIYIHGFVRCILKRNIEEMSMQYC